MAENLVFTLLGRDRVSQVFNQAAGSAVRFQRQVEEAADSSSDALAQFTRDANGRLRDARGRFLSAGEAARLGLGDGIGGGAERGRRGLAGLLGGLGRIGGVLGSLGGAAAGLGRIGALAGSAVPAVAGLAGALAQVAPAAGVAATGFIGVKLASTALKVGMIGVEEAVTAALDPSKAAEFSESLQKLSPNARSFVTELRSMSPELDKIRKSIQDRLFQDLDTTLKNTASATLPMLSTALRESAGTLNLMGRGVLNTATGLAESGALGKALGGATRGLRSLSALPATVVQGLVQIGAAAAPSFERLAKAGGGLVERLSQRLTAAFESGRMERAIGQAVGLLGQLGDAAGNVFTIVGNVFAAAQTNGGGLIGTLQTITGELAKVTASPAVQQALGALFQTMATLATTAAPLLGQALGALGPVLSTLGPPVQMLIQSLGAALQPVIAALGPVLQTAAGAVGSLLQAVAPLLPVVGQLVAALLPALTPILSAVGERFGQMAPVVQQLATALSGALTPILAQLPVVIAPLMSHFTMLTGTLLPVLSQLLVALSPSLASLGVSFGQVLVALSPLLTAFTQLTSSGLQAMTPAITRVIGLTGQLASVLAGVLAKYVTSYVVPALRLVTSLLRGDFSSAWNQAKTLVGNVGGFFQRISTQIGTWIGQGVNKAVTWLQGLPGRGAAALSPLAGRLASQASAAGSRLVAALRGKISEAVSLVQSLPGRASAALGGLGSRLWGAGASLIQGFIDGISSKIAAVRDTLSGLTNMLPDWKGPAKKDARLLYRNGQLLIGGFIRGIHSSTPKLQETLRKITAAIPKDARRRLDDHLRASTRRLQKLVGEREKVMARIQKAQQFAGNITTGARQFAALSTVGGERITAGSIRAGLQSRLARIQHFTRYIKILAQRGFSKTLLRQILEMGPEQGYAYASALVGADATTLRAINRTQGQLNEATTSLGRIGADRLYDAGKYAGRGFLEGLKAQQKSIERLMLDIARGMQRSTRKALGIRSPSTVMAGLGRNVTQGLAVGVLQDRPVLARAVGQLSDTISSGVASAPMPAAAVPRGSGGQQPMVININVSGALDPQATAREIRRVLLQLKRDFGGAALGVA